MWTVSAADGLQRQAAVRLMQPGRSVLQRSLLTAGPATARIRSHYQGKRRHGHHYRVPASGLTARLAGSDELAWSLNTTQERVRSTTGLGGRWYSRLAGVMIGKTMLPVWQKYG